MFSPLPPSGTKPYSETRQLGWGVSRRRVAEGTFSGVQEVRPRKLIANYRKEMVGREGIEPPTPGFSGLLGDRRNFA
jgi:hypothetical protein